MARSRVRRTGTVALACGALVLAAGCGSSSKSSTNAGASTGKLAAIPAGTIKLGALYSLSGPLAAYGANEKATEEILIDNLNANGGIAGHQVELIAVNDGGDPTTAVAQAKALVSKKVAAIVYTGTVTTNSQTTPVFMKAKIPVITFDPTDTWADGKKWPYAFDLLYVNKLSAENMIDYAKNTQKVTKLGLLHDTTSFGAALASDVESEAKSKGLEVTTASFDIAASDVSTQISQLKSAGVNGLAVVGSGGYGTVWNGLQAAGWSPPTVSHSGVYFSGFTSLGSLAKTTFSICDAYSLKKGEQPDASLAKILKVVTDKFGVHPDATTPVIYGNDTLLILKQVIEENKSLDAAAIKASIEKISDKSFTTPSIAYTFSADNHAGYVPTNLNMCHTDQFGPYGIPIVADKS
jgi:branched-chain amino acid transport system substrate-binding protein